MPGAHGRSRGRPQLLGGRRHARPTARAPMAPLTERHEATIALQHHSNAHVSYHFHTDLNRKWAPTLRRHEGGSPSHPACDSLETI